MLIHPWDAGTDDEWRAFLSAQDVGTLICPTEDLEGLPAGARAQLLRRTPLG